MLITVNAADPTPLYKQVADRIRHLIACGTLREGMPLPSVRQVAGDLGVNLNTVATAYRELQDEGLVAVKQGAGTVVTAGRTHPRNHEELRKPLRVALTQLALAGLSRDAILELVSSELDTLDPKGGSQWQD